MMLRTLSVAAAATTLMLAAPAANAASVVSREQGPGGAQTLDYTAAPGETNKITVSASYEQSSNKLRITLTDAGVTQIAIGTDPGYPGACAAGSTPNALVCTYVMQRGTITDGGGALILGISAGDGTDQITFDASTTALALDDGQTQYTSLLGFVNGGDGSDTLTDLGEGQFRPIMFGDNGNDSLRGGPGDNVLGGGAGSDVFFGYEGADEMQGGPGTDSLTYRDGREPGGVIVNALEETFTMTAATKVSGNSWDVSANPAASQGDLVAGIENILGTAYNDVLVGNSAANILTGSGGKDTLYGMGGNDTLVVTGAPGRLYGGAGNDTLSARNGAADTRLDCGPDTDVANLDLIDTGWIACESTIRQ